MNLLIYWLNQQKQAVEEALAKEDVRINHQKKIQAVSLTDGVFG